MLIVEVEDILIMFMEGGGDDINGMKSCFFDFVVPVLDRRTASLIVFLAKIVRSEWHSTYAVLMSGYSSNNILALCFCLPVHLSAT